MSNLEHIKKPRVFYLKKLLLNNKEKNNSLIFEKDQHIRFSDKYIEKYLNEQNNFLNDVSLEELNSNNIFFDKEDDLNNVNCGVAYDNGKLIFKDENISKKENIYNCYYSGSDRVYLNDLVRDLELFSNYNRIPNFGLVYDFKFKNVNYEQFKYYNFFTCLTADAIVGFYSLDKLINDEYTIKKNKNYLYVVNQGNPQYPPYSGWLDEIEYAAFGWIDLDKIILVNDPNNFWNDENCLSIVTKKFLDRKKALILLLLNYANGIWELNSSNKIVETQFRIVDKTSQMQLDLTGVKNGLQKILTQSIKMGYLGDLINPVTGISIGNNNTDDVCDVNCKKIKVNKCDGTIYEKDCSQISTADGSIEDKVIGNFHLISPQIKIHTRNNLRSLLPDILNTIDPIHWTTGNLNKFQSESVKKIVDELKNKFGSDNYEVTPLNENRAFHYADGTFYKGFATGGFYSRYNSNGIGYKWGTDLSDEEWNGITWRVLGSKPEIERGLGLGGGNPSLFVTAWGSRPIWLNKSSITNYSIQSFPQLYDNNSHFIKYDTKELYDINDPNNILATVAAWSLVNKLNPVVHKHSVAGTIKITKSNTGGKFVESTNKFTEITFQDTNECIEGCTIPLDGLLKFLSKEKIASSFKEVITGMCFNGTQGPPLILDFRNIICSQEITGVTMNISGIDNTIINYRDFDNTFIYFNTIYAERTKTEEEIEKEKNEIYDDKILCIRRIANASGLDEEVLDKLNTMPPEFLVGVAAITSEVNNILINCNTYKCETDFTTLLFKTIFGEPPVGNDVINNSGAAGGTTLSIKGQQKLIKKLREKELIPGEIENITKEITKKLSKCIDPITRFEETCIFTDNTRAYPVRTIGTLYLGKTTKGIATGGKTAPYYYIQNILNETPKNNIFSKYTKQVYNSYLSPIVNLVFEWNGIAWTRKEDMPEDVAYHCGVGDEKWSIYWGGLHSSIERPDISIKFSECDTYKNYVISFNGVYNKFGWKLPLGNNDNYSHIVKYTDFANEIYEFSNNTYTLKSKTYSYNEKLNEEINQICPNNYSNDDVYYVLEIEQIDSALSFEVENQNMSHYYQFAFPYSYGVYSPTQKNFISNTLHRYISFSPITNFNILFKSIDLTEDPDDVINICNTDISGSKNWLKITGTKIDARHGKILHQSISLGKFSDLRQLLNTNQITVTVNYTGSSLSVSSNISSAVSFQPTSVSPPTNCDINSKFTVFNINGNLISGPIHGEHTKISTVIYTNSNVKNIKYYNIKNFSSKIEENNTSSNIVDNIYYCPNYNSTCDSSNYYYKFDIFVPQNNNYVTYDNVSIHNVLSTDLNYFETYMYKYTDLCDMLKNGFSKPDGGSTGEFLVYYSETTGNRIPVWPWVYPSSVIGSTVDTFFIKRKYPLETAPPANNIFYEVISRFTGGAFTKVSRAIFADKKSSGNVIPNFGISSDIEITQSINDNTYYNISNCFTNSENKNYFFPWNVLGDNGSIGPRGIAEAFDADGNYWLAIGDSNNLPTNEITKKNKSHTNIFTIVKINKNNLKALYNFVLQKANIYLAECAKSDFIHWYTMLASEQKIEYEIETLSPFINDYPLVFSNEAVRNREGYLELINNLISSSIGVFDLYVRLYDYYEFDTNNIQEPFVNHILNQNPTNTLSNCPIPEDYLEYSLTQKYSRIEKFNLVSNPTDVFCLSCDACDLSNEEEYEKLYKNKNWKIHNSDFWVSPIVQSPFAGVTNREGFDILLKLNSCNNRWGTAIWSMVDNGILFLNYKKNNIFIDEKNNHIILSSLQSMLTVNNYKDGISLDVPVLNLYNEFIFDLNDYKLPNGEFTPIIHYIKKLEKNKNFCDESYVVYTPQYKVQRLLIGNTIINKTLITDPEDSNSCDYYSKTIDDNYKMGYFNISNTNNPPPVPPACLYFNPPNKNIINKYLVQNKFKTTIQDMLSILNVPYNPNSNVNNLLQEQYNKYAVIIDPIADVDYTEWVTNFVQEYKAEKILESGASEKYFFKYDINEVGSNCLFGKEEINDQNIVFTSWRRFQDSSGLGGDVPLFSELNASAGLCVYPYQYFIGQKAFGDPDKAIICGGFNVMENSMLSLTHSLWDYKTNAPTFKWNRFVINPEDSFNKNYTYRSFTIFDRKTQKPVYNDSIMGVALFDIAGPVVIERTGKAIFDGTSNKVKVLFEPVPYFLNNKTFYSIMLTPSDNVRVWWENKQENSFEIYCEINKWKGEVDWKILYIEDVSTQNSIIHSINSGKNTYDIFEEK